jgi:hypothetical protein
MMIQNLQFPHEFYDKHSKNIVCFLPAVRSKDIYPYYPRINWKDRIQNADLLYLADPFQNIDAYQTAGGSWYISPEGKSLLPDLSVALHDFFRTKQYQNVVLYGSSMGGYAAIIIGSLIENSKVIAECPQVFLEKHPGSADVMSRFCDEEKARALPNVIERIKNGNSSEYSIVTNVHDHHVKDHIIPLINTIQTLPITAQQPRVNFRFYSDESYKRGHTAMTFEDAFPIIMQNLN